MNEQKKQYNDNKFQFESKIDGILVNVYGTLYKPNEKTPHLIGVATITLEANGLKTTVRNSNVVITKDGKKMFISEPTYKTSKKDEHNKDVYQSYYVLPVEIKNYVSAEITKKFIV